MTNTLVSSPNITGNIGSCKVDSQTYSLSSFYKETVAVNTCTGEIVSRTTWYDYGYIYQPTVIIFVMVAIMFGVKKVLES